MSEKVKHGVSYHPLSLRPSKQALGGAFLYFTVTENLQGKLPGAQSSMTCSPSTYGPFSFPCSCRCRSHTKKIKKKSERITKIAAQKGPIFSLKSETKQREREREKRGRFKI